MNINKEIKKKFWKTLTLKEKFILVFWRIVWGFYYKILFLLKNNQRLKFKVNFYKLIYRLGLITTKKYMDILLIDIIKQIAFIQYYNRQLRKMREVLNKK